MAQTLGSVAVGSIVKIDENGSPVNYIVVHIGNPDVRLYGSACDGAWLLRQDIVENVQWNSTNANTLVGSTIMSTMAGYLGRYESHIQSAIKTVKIPYHPGNGGPLWDIKSGENGLECKLFPLCGYEVGLSGISGVMPIDGAKLDYFKSGLDTEANSKRIAKLNGAAAAWWLRSPVSTSTDGKFYVLPDGSLGSTSVNPSYGALPAMIMDPTILVSDDGTVGVPASPTALTVPIQVMQGRQITVSWSAVDGVSSYILERKANTDADWVQVYSGANTSFEETVGTWTSVQYRVKSLANGKYGDYTTSTSVSVVPLSALVISGSDGSLGTLTNDVQYSVSSSGTSTLTVTETINGVNTRTYTATNGADNKISVVDLPTGAGTIKITASTNPSSGVVSVTREWTYTKAAITFPDAGSVADLTQQGKTIWAKTIAEAVRAPGIWGGNLGLALQKLARSVLYNRSQAPKYSEVTVDLATAKEGNIISLPENGQMVEFYVTKHDYESGLNGAGRTLVVRKDLYIARPWDTDGVNAYSTSDIDIWMESTYKPMLDSSVQSEIGTTKIYYTPGNGNDTVTTLERGVFQLSATEMGGTGVNFNVEGTVLPISETLQQASNGPQIIWTRTPTIGRTNTAISLSRNPNPSFDNTFCTATQKWYYRPAFTLPSTFESTYYVGSDGTVHDEQEYEEAGTLTDISGGAIPIVSIETGSYVGTGALGNANPSSLTFSAPPAFLLISNGGASHFILMDVVALTTSFTARAYLYVETDGALKTTSTVYAKRDGNTVSWYIDEAKPYAQCNQQGLAYTYLALLGGAA
jgi:hypothetical protein